MKKKLRRPRRPPEPTQSSQEIRAAGRAFERPAGLKFPCAWD
ncbi:hypothetical protein HMPREF9440_01781 [Sutterella parvirubra YIT 11816]|uniref:Uncharacterized protein n=1 Tax=Sutterella parvirubra YIT 11816 TaxID=762967 RepID=H3KGA2_9BURK|nr:hypothetical protein HMPREF9440_01781 [Sutterella parvirubra YIT 11816]